MNPLSNRSFRQRLLRANGPARCQPRATPWVSRREQPSPDGAAQAPRPDLVRPYRAQSERNPKPRAMPWAVIVRTVGAKEAERSQLPHLPTRHPQRPQLLHLRTLIETLRRHPPAPPSPRPAPNPRNRPHHRRKDVTTRNQAPRFKP